MFFLIERKFDFHVAGAMLKSEKNVKYCLGKLVTSLEPHELRWAKAGMQIAHVGKCSLRYYNQCTSDR